MTKHDCCILCSIVAGLMEGEEVMAYCTKLKFNKWSFGMEKKRML